MRKLLGELWPLPIALGMVLALLSVGVGAQEGAQEDPQENASRKPPKKPAPVIKEGTDCWHTERGTAQDFKFPANYFGRGSQQVKKQTIRFEGVPLDPEYVAAPYPEGCGCPEEVDTTVTWLDRHGNVAKDMRHAVTQVVNLTTDIDTCVRRKNAAKFKGQGAAAKVEIELVALSLKSVNPLKVNYRGGSKKEFDIRVTNTASQRQRTGSMTFTAGKIKKGHVKGDVKLNALHINYDVVFQERGGPFKKEDTLKLTLMGTEGWFMQ